MYFHRNRAIFIPIPLPCHIQQYLVASLHIKTFVLSPYKNNHWQKRHMMHHTIAHTRGVPCCVVPSWILNELKFIEFVFILPILEKRKAHYEQAARRPRHLSLLWETEASTNSKIVRNNLVQRSKRAYCWKFVISLVLSTIKDHKARTFYTVRAFGTFIMHSIKNYLHFLTQGTAFNSTM